MKLYRWLVAASLVFMSSCAADKDDAALGIIPLPNQVEFTSGTFILPAEATVSLPAGEGAEKALRYLSGALLNAQVSLTPVEQGEEADICFLADDTLSAEAYRLTIGSQGIRIVSRSDGAGWFYGVQSLLQLLPPAVADASTPFTGVLELPAVSLTDAPRFPYRGAMMDVGRNFLPKEEVLRFLDLMAAYKMNVFHFHLTDDQGWRIEIKKYPRLTDVGARRSQTLVGHSDYYYPRQYDGKEQRGFYTQDDIREIVRYAADRFITVIPEIEMPGHASAALAAYPELSCGLGKTYMVRDYFDVFDEVYCPKETTLRFLEDVLAEIMELFPSHYIHIGGDECPKKAWKKCAHCQALMKREGLADEEALQSWFVHRIERFVNSRGRDIIGWDEILEGGIAPNATVMSWRGEEGGIDAARQHHKVIMTPGVRCYFDFYQAAPEQEPLAMGGFLPLDTVYGYNPLPDVLTAEEQDYIIGTQANIWGEYIQTPAHFEYMAFPRLLAMAEVQWTQPARKDFASFARRLDREFARLDARGVHACRSFYEVRADGAWDDARETYEVTLQTYCPDAEIRYAFNDSLVTASSALYREPLPLSDDAVVYAAAFRNGQPLGKVTRTSFAINKATGCTYSSSETPALGDLTNVRSLTDGRRGHARDRHRWLTFRHNTVQLVLKLHRAQKIHEVAFASLWRPWNALWPVRAARVSVSMNGEHFVPVADSLFVYDFKQREATRFPIALSFSEVEASFVRLELVGGGLCPKGYYEEGKPSEFSLDEIEIH